MQPNPEPSSAEPVLEILDDLVPVELHTAAWAACSAAGWKFGHGSHGEDPLPFWKLDLDGDPAMDAIWKSVRERCERLAGGPLRILRVYANGHTYGLGGKAHSDDHRPGTFTLLYYPMPEWKPGWDGETVYFDSDGEIALAVRPRPNRAVFFDSRIAHEGRAPSRSCNALRVTVAFKLETCAANAEIPVSESAVPHVEAVEIEREGALRVYSVRVPAAALQDAARERLAELGKSVRLPGFRPGKIPEAVLLERYGAKARAEALDRLAGEALDRAVPKGRVPANIEVKPGAAAGELEVRASVTVLADLPQLDPAGLRILRLSALEADLASFGVTAEEAGVRLREDVKRQALDFLDAQYRFPVRPELIEGELAAIMKAIEGEADAASFRELAERRLRLGFVIAELARRLGIPPKSGAEVEDAVIDALVAQAAVEERPATVSELRELL
jgi:SM-20-related protein